MHSVVRVAYALEVILAAAAMIFVTALGTYGVGQAVSALFPETARMLAYVASLPLQIIADLLSSVGQTLMAVWTALADWMRAVSAYVVALIPPGPPRPNCICTPLPPPNWVALSDAWRQSFEALRHALANALWLATPVGLYLLAWMLDRVRPIPPDGWYLDRGTLHDAAATIGASLGVLIELVAWVIFFSLMYDLGAWLWTPLALLLMTYAWVGAALFALIASLPLAPIIAAIVISLGVGLVFVFVVRDTARAIRNAVAAPGTPGEKVRNAWRSGLTAARETALAPIAPLLALVDRVIRWIQQQTVAALMGRVHPAFPRQPEHVGRQRASERRKSIMGFLNNGTLPVLRTEYRLAPGDQRKFREHVVTHQVEEEGPPRLVSEFLEFPPGSPMVLRQSCLSEGFEEAVGQYVRLKFETQQPTQRSLWQRLWAFERPEETIVPLLARVVDVAILADRHADTLRRESDWPAKPFYERIYAEYRPLPFPLQYLLRPLIGDGLPARVVIETHYEEVFFNALFGRGALTTRYASWFGIGIQIRKPRTLKSNRVAWTKPQAQCRRLKSHVAGVLSGRIDVTFIGPPGDQVAGPPARVTVQQSRLDGLHIMPSGPLADGCPSVVRPVPYPAPFDPGPSGVAAPTNPLPSAVQGVKIPLAPRGAVSNALPAWLFPVKNRLFSDCQGNCLKLQGTVAEQTMQIAQSAVGTIVQRSSLLPRRYRDPNRRRLYRRVWSGAFFDPNLGLWNRFPVFGCSYTVGEGRPRADLRGAFAKTMFAGPPFRWLRGFSRRQQAEREWRTFGGVFVSAQGPRHAGNLLLPEPLLHDYLNHLAQRDAVMTAQRAGDCKGPAFVPKPAEPESR